MGRLVSIGEAAQIKGVSIDTLRYWENMVSFRLFVLKGDTEDIDYLI